MSKSYEQYRHINNRFLSIGVRSSSSLSTGTTICTAATRLTLSTGCSTSLNVMFFAKTSCRLLSFIFIFFFFYVIIAYDRGEQCDMCIFATNIVKTLRFLNTIFDIRLSATIYVTISEISESRCKIDMSHAISSN